MGDLDFESTKELQLPTDPFERIIGQEEAVRIARLISKQKRNLLLVGPPGTGKSMIAQAISSVLPAPSQEISIVHNEEAPERPIVELRTKNQIEEQDKKSKIVGKVAEPSAVPFFVAERLGFRCARCGAFSEPHLSICPSCGAEKYLRQIHIRVGEMYNNLEVSKQHRPRISTTRKMPDGKEEKVMYEKTSDGKIKVLNHQDIRKLKEFSRKTKRKVIIALNRPSFVQASGASETELLGDVRHDPYGGHPKLGTLPYLRVVPGAIHEAHEGVLFLDELSTLGHVQKFILTAMQEKHFPIVGRNPTSSGAIVRVDAVPCNFVLVGSVNINELGSLVPALRSRIRGDGYEVLMHSYMPNDATHRKEMAQFISQEIIKDGKIPHAHKDAVKEVIEEGQRIAKTVDNVSGITLRLRALAGIIKLAGDIAVVEESDLTRKNHVQLAIKNAKSIEEQMSDKYETWWRAGTADHGFKSSKAGTETA